jgi:hypothetical protein
LTIKAGNESAFKFDIEWLNKGVAPAYSEYQLRGKLTSIIKQNDPVYFTIKNSGNRNWLPDVPVTESYSTEFKERLNGTYSFALQLFDTRSGRPVEIGLKEQIRDSEGYYLISDIEF